ncbi:MAG: lysophospholipid acyltransferase family protein [Planctomycetota bacterium]|nr:lysophospholipid acyltransferase family protein [Planctomycetota bacterium]
MAAPSSAIALWSQYLAARVAAMAVTSFDVASNLRTAAAIGRGLYTIDRKHRERTLRHLAVAMPELGQSAREEIAVRSFEHFMQLVVEVCHTPQALHPGNWAAHTRLTKLGPAIEVLNAGKPAILVTGHLGNWEVLGYLMAVLGYRCDAIARPIDNRLISDWLMGVRQRRGLRIITKWDATDRMLDVLRAGGALGFIADQNAGDKGLFVPFFGRLASSYKSIALLALGQNVPIICGYARRIGPGYRYELGAQDVIRPEEWASKRDPVYYVTARYMRAIEMMIRGSPEQYLWMHRRWKSRPRHEREGKPMSASLRRNLEELPWMDAATLERLAEPMPAV